MMTETITMNLMAFYGLAFGLPVMGCAIGWIIAKGELDV